MHSSNLSLQIGNGLFASQVFALLGGLFLIAIGAAIAYTLGRWRLHGVPFEGEIVGVRRRGPSVHGVYRYESPDGGMREATSVQGRSTGSGLETGRRVPIRVMPERPDEAREQRAPLGWALAIVLLLLGAWLVDIGVTESEHSPFVWLLMALVAGLVARWLWVRARTLYEKLRPLAASRRWSDVPIERAEATGATSSSSVQFSGTGPRTRRAGLIFVALGLALVAIDAWKARELLHLGHGVRTSGVVVDLGEGSSGRSGDTFLYPVVQYTRQDGRIVRFDDRTRQRPSPFKVGDTVPMLYVPDQPTAATIDRGASDWEPLAALAVMGVASIGIGALALRAR